MKYGFVWPFGDVRACAGMARQAEKAGWDGFFVADLLWGIDAWVSLAAAAMTTRRIRLGTMLTPLSRMRPWKLAGETVTLDHLSNGRVNLAVGLGAIDSGFAEFGEATDRKIRAERLDEGLEILTGLWRGQPFNYKGKHYQIKETRFPAPPPPVQKPRIPIWVVGMWPRQKSMRRAIKYDGLLPAMKGEDGKWIAFGPDHIREMKAYIDANRADRTPFDIVVEGTTPGDKRKAAPIIRKWAGAGVTWWIESRWGNTEKAVIRRLQQGPPD